MSRRVALTDFPLEVLEERFAKIGERRFRARQVVRWIYGKGVGDFAKMTDLAAGLRAQLPKHFEPFSTQVEEERRAPGGTRKLLIKLRDGDLIEAVLIPEKNRRTVCISTQVGCPVGCVFCASGIGGLRRNLSQGEIVEQILHARAGLKEDERITNVVLMGIGEPLLNYENVKRAMQAMRASWGLNIGYNKITLSTVGLPDRIRRLLKDKVVPNLAISLHAPNDALRRRLIPNASRWTIRELLDTGRQYAQEARKEVTFEYVLLNGVNDGQDHAEELGKRLAGSRVKVNVIPYNRVREFKFSAPRQDRVDRFVRTLGRYKVYVSARRRRGKTIDAACGQLRSAALSRRPVTRGR
jgi:23S rRNA (adenine2503-C2)-methyltransferase